MNAPDPATPASGPAVGTRLDRSVGRLAPERANLSPLKQRIVDALTAAPRSGMCYHDLAAHLFPDPRSWRYSSNGGPPGWAMPLGRALRELHAAGIAQELRRKGGGPGHGMVVLL